MSVTVKTIHRGEEVQSASFNYEGPEWEEAKKQHDTMVKQGKVDHTIVVRYNE